MEGEGESYKPTNNVEREHLDPTDWNKQNEETEWADWYEDTGETEWTEWEDHETVSTPEDDAWDIWLTRTKLLAVQDPNSWPPLFVPLTRSDLLSIPRTI
jgi:hypothetical protein